MGTPEKAEAADPSVDGEVRAIVQVVATTLLANLLGREQDAQRLAADLEGDPELPAYWDVRRRLSVATLQARRGDNEESLATLDGGIEIALAGGGCDFFGAHMMLTTVFFMALRAGRTDLIPVYERLAEGALARQPAPGTAQALNCAKGLLEVWGGDPTSVPDRVAAAEDIGGLQVVFFNAFPACLEALHAGLIGDLTGALQARSRIDDARVRPIRPEPVTYAEWGVSLPEREAWSGESS